MFSIWEQPTLNHSDYLIIGAGITGLSTAAALLERQPKARVRILERGLLPSGASTKNAGFACLGSLSELAADLQHYGETAVKASLQLKYAGLKRLRERLGDENIGYQAHGGYELLLHKHHHRLEELDSLNKFTEASLGKALFREASTEQMQRVAFHSKQIAALIYLPEEGQLHTGKMMDTLARYVRTKGAEVLTGCEVVGIEARETGVRVKVKDPISGQLSDFSADKLACCTNGFTAKLFPEIALAPGRGQVLVTEPLPKLPFKGTFHIDEGYLYFRDLNNAVLLGGGRNHYKNEETTTKLQTTAKVQDFLEKFLREVILPHYPAVKIRKRWSGIMGFRAEGLLPLIRLQDARIALGVGMNGMGVAAGSEVGARVADLLLEDD